MKKLLMLALVVVGLVAIHAGQVFAEPTAPRTDLTAPTSKNTYSDPAAKSCPTTDCGVVKKYLNPLIRLFSVLVGVGVVVGIIIAGIQYATSGGDPQKTASAKNHIRNSVIALIAFFFLYAFLQFAIPGGVTP